MSKERLEEVKENWNNVDWVLDKSDIIWPVEQAELEQNHSRKIDQLDMFLQKNVETKAEHFGKHVIDVTMEIIKELTEQVQELEKLCEQLIGEEWMNDEGLYESEMMKLDKQNKRYRNLLESLSKTRNIPAKIMKEQPDKKIIDANDILQYILRKINDELERESNERIN